MAADAASIVDDISCHCIGARVRILSRVVSGIFDDAMRPHGLKVSQVNLLVVTARLKVARPAEVCSILQMDRSTLSRNLDRLESGGWIERLDDTEDGRAAPFELTAQGRRFLTKAYPDWKRAQAEAEAILGAGGAEFLNAAVARAREYESKS